MPGREGLLTGGPPFTEALDSRILVCVRYDRKQSMGHAYETAVLLLRKPNTMRIQSVWKISTSLSNAGFERVASQVYVFYPS